MTTIQKLILGGGGLVIMVMAVILFGLDSSPKEVSNQVSVKDSDMVGEKLPVAAGAYAIDTTRSVVNWSGKKPLVDGYVNSGTLKLAEGTIVGDGETVTGSFVIDMNSLRAGLTTAKPGQETALEGHLKGERWFDVAMHPNAVFVIKSLTPVSDDSFAFTIEGDLTMKGVTAPVMFSAVIYQDEGGEVIAEAATEIDRTKWGVTAGSGSFFDSLADNVIDDMIALSFVLVATKE